MSDFAAKVRPRMTQVTGPSPLWWWCTGKSTRDALGAPDRGSAGGSRGWRPLALKIVIGGEIADAGMETNATVTRGTPDPARVREGPDPRSARVWPHAHHSHEGLDLRLLDYLRPSDTLVVWRPGRPGRNLRHATVTVIDLQAREVGFRSLTTGSTPPPLVGSSSTSSEP